MFISWPHNENTKRRIKTINDQIDEFFGHGGKVEKIETGKSGVKDGAKYKFSI